MADPILKARDLPIPFSAPMVSALMAEISMPGLGKTQTRRTHPPKPRFEPVGCRPCDLGGRACWWDYWSVGHAETHRFKLPYAEGDRLYVREDWQTSLAYDELPPRDLREGAFVRYDADGQTNGLEGRAHSFGRVRRAMHMPKWASRITLLVTEVRVHPLQHISSVDARAEGIDFVAHSAICHGPDCQDDPARICSQGDCDAAIRTYAGLWDDLHGIGAWALDPWVAAYTFRPVIGNIDQIGRQA